MFMWIVATSDKAWTPSSSTLPSEFFKDVDSDILEENREENAINDVHNSNDVRFDGNNQKRKTPGARNSHFKTGRKKSSK
ncbi:hypothetical protein Golax_017614 [Gossypium laxum]|uniref:Uncharacterized protein n=1 Tax=Gossypium laxum TaxID=34288 RepID=A0A7J8Z1G0_9ROSI|nr:hypothetical protein [Gossypium laxum]